MKIRILPVLVAGIMAATVLLSSCLGNSYEEIDYPSESSIASFSIGTLYKTFYGKSSKGEDSIYTDTVSYASVPFTIDQINRRIYNNDSLPNGVDITRVVTSISADYPTIYYEKEGKDTIWTSSDSLDFTNPIIFKVMSYSQALNQFKMGAPYEVKINVHKQNPDSLVWKHIGNKTFGENIVMTKQKAVYLNGNIYLFGETDSETKVYKANVDKGNFSTWEDVTPGITDIDIYSAISFNDDIYFVAGGKMYNMSSDSPIGSRSNWSNLISVTGNKLLAYTTENKVIKFGTDGTEESETDFINGETLEGRISAISYSASHNSSLWRTIVMKNGAQEDTATCVFSHISSDNEWIKYQPNNPATCPNQKDISMISYNGKLYAFGGMFDYFYSSTDNGLSWIKETGYMIFPSEEKNGIKPLTSYKNNGSYSVVVEDNVDNGSFMWFIWQDGSLTRGHLNKLVSK